MEELLRVENVSMQFGGLKALSNVSLSVKKGEIYTLIGPNGAGKTTLFNVISGFLAPTEGKVIYEGQEVQGLPPHKLTPIGISRTFQNIRLLTNISVLDNIRLGYHIHMKQTFADTLFMTSRYRKEEEMSVKNAMELLDFVGLTGYEATLAKNLPYGFQRKVEIARAIATGAQLLLLDEPCAGMNSSEKMALSDLILRINQELKRTIFLIEHDMRFVMKISDEITVLAQGQFLAHGTPEEIQNNPQVIETYLGTGRKGKGRGSV